MTAVLTAASGVAGLLVGSFLNVVVARVPAGGSVVRPASACPDCGAPVRPRDNVPVLSWLLLRGRCRDCRGRISARYPAVELLTAVLFAVLAARLGADPVLPAYLFLAAVGVALAAVDLDLHKLPDRLVLPSYPVATALLVLASVLGSDSGDLVRALLGGLAMYVFYRALYELSRRGMGFGDVKLAGVLGLYTGWLGWGAWCVGLFGGFLFGGTWGIALLLSGRGGRKSKVPFGPFMLAGVLLAVLYGERLAGWYLDLTVRA